MIYLEARELPVAGCPVVTNHMLTRGNPKNCHKVVERWATPTPAVVVSGRLCWLRTPQSEPKRQDQRNDGTITCGAYCNLHCADEYGARFIGFGRER
jgi:hypothetical protein